MKKIKGKGYFELPFSTEWELNGNYRMEASRWKLQKLTLKSLSIFDKAFSGQ